MATLGSRRTERIVERLRATALDKLVLSTPFVALTTAVIVFVDAVLHQRVPGGTARAGQIASIALAAIVGTVPVAISTVFPGWRSFLSALRNLPARQRRSWKSFVLSFQLALVLLIPVAHLAMAGNRFPNVEWYRYGFLDKRWLLALYWIVVASILLFPPLIQRLLGEGDGEVTRVPASAELDSPSRPSWAQMLWTFFGAAALSLFFFGPPWNVERTALYVDLHEQVHFGPLQAIHRGSLPNIGPASQQYGPGTQLLNYTLMKLSGEFTLVGFRKAQGVVFFAGFAFYSALALSYLGPSWGLLALFLSLSVSPFHLAYWNDLGGFASWGWPNPLRYLGGLFLVLTVASLVTKRRSTRPIDAYVLGVGWVWGLFAWISPENLMMGGIASALLLSLLWATGTVALRRTIRVAFNIILGGTLFWLPILAFYARAGRLREYVDNTFSVGGYVLAGYSNIATSGSISSDPGNSVLFYGFTPLVLAIGFVVLHENGSSRRPLKWRHVLLLALVSVSLASFWGSLTRTDIYHLLNTLAALPLLLAYAMKVVPPCVAATTRGRFLVRAGLVAFAFFAAFFRYDASWYIDRLANPLAKYRAPSTMTAVPDHLRGGSFERTGYQALPERVSLEASVTPRDFKSVVEMSHYFSMLDAVTRGLGAKVTFIHSLPGVEPGFGYFFGDIEPAPVLLDPSTMVVSSEVRSRFLEHFQTIVDDIGCIVATGGSFPPPEVELFSQSTRDVAMTRVTFRDHDIHIACK